MFIDGQGAVILFLLMVLTDMAFGSCNFTGKVKYLHTLRIGRLPLNLVNFSSSYSNLDGELDKQLTWLAVILF